jgi:hypothetical protein
MANENIREYSHNDLTTDGWLVYHTLGFVLKWTVL